ncbi:MAG TPA: DUF4157 domain-containing protein, partial [Kofleriaceae bacterium]
MDRPPARAPRPAPGPGGPVQPKIAPVERDRAPAPPQGSGQPLSGDVRSRMDRLFGTDFSAVRVHEGPEAPAIGAAAYTQGSDIHFAPGQYDPTSPRGQELLGHELTHVVQQAEGRVPDTRQAKNGAKDEAKNMAIHDDAGLEREADEMGARATRGEQVRTGAAAPIGEAGSRGVGPPTALPAGRGS